MAVRVIRWGQAGLAVALAGILVLAGCGKKQEPAPEQGQGSAAPGNGAASPAVDARLSQTFAEATLPEPSDAVVELPAVTMTGKSVGKLYEETVQGWAKVPFIAPSGKRIGYVATLDTELGPIDIELKPDLAPNHVRSFVALARAGYYDGLVFERLVRDVAEYDPNLCVELVEAGSPIGNGDARYGSIGYWLKPEFLDQVPEASREQAKHEEGSVGACLGEGPDTGACRFYVLLSKAPSLDGERTIFGKVTRGLDLVRRIASQPVVNSSELPEGTPQNPIIIRKVTIQAKEVDNSAVASNNK